MKHELGKLAAQAGADFLEPPSGDFYSFNADDGSLERFAELVNGGPWGTIDPDYARVFTQARCVAWQYGYTCVMHGSFTRDLDLLLVPWTEQAKGNDEQLLKLIASSCDLRFSDGVDEIYKAKVDFTTKPHGRKSCSLHFKGFGDRRWVDISVMPVTAKDRP